MLLNGTPFAFVIDLAALASRREYLKLDKWLTDKIREHGVSRICPFITDFKYWLLKELKKNNLLNGNYGVILGFSCSA